MCVLYIVAILYLVLVRETYSYLGNAIYFYLRSSSFSTEGIDLNVFCHLNSQNFYEIDWILSCARNIGHNSGDNVSSASDIAIINH